MCAGTFKKGISIYISIPQKRRRTSLATGRYDLRHSGLGERHVHWQFFCPWRSIKVRLQADHHLEEAINTLPLDYKWHNIQAAQTGKVFHEVSRKGSSEQHFYPKTMNSSEMHSSTPRHPLSTSSPLKSPHHSFSRHQIFSGRNASLWKTHYHGFGLSKKEHMSRVPSNRQCTCFQDF